jgi:hypothetical protein
MTRHMANQPNASNPAISRVLYAGRRWRGVAGRDRWAEHA